MEQLRGLIGCGHAWAEQRALMALELADQYASNQISKDEYLELLQDLIRTDVLDHEANDMQVKTALVTAVYGAMQLA